MIRPFANRPQRPTTLELLKNNFHTRLPFLIRRQFSRASASDDVLVDHVRWVVVPLGIIQPEELVAAMEQFNSRLIQIFSTCTQKRSINRLTRDKPELGIRAIVILAFNMGDG